MYLHFWAIRLVRGCDGQYWCMVGSDGLRLDRVCCVSCWMCVYVRGDDSIVCVAILD